MAAKLGHQPRRGKSGTVKGISEGTWVHGKHRLGTRLGEAYVSIFDALGSELRSACSGSKSRVPNPCLKGTYSWGTGNGEFGGSGK